MGYGYEIVLERVAVTGAITLVQYKASANNSAYVSRAWCSQHTTAISTMQPIEIVRKTAAATVSAFTPRPVATTLPAALGVGSTSGTGTNASAEGTDGNAFQANVFNLLTGWLYVAGLEDERIWIPPGGIIALKLPVAPGSSTTFSAGLGIVEIQG